MNRPPRAAKPISPRWRGLLAAAALAVFQLACGKVGAPVPPARFTERTADLEAIQRGNRVFLSWPVPPLGRDPSSRFYIDRAEIYRAIEGRAEEPILDPDDFEELSQLVGTIDRQTLEEQAKSGQLSFQDALNLANAADLANLRLRYAVRYFNRRGQAGAYSNTVAIEPVASVADAPSGLRVAEEAQDAITLVWEAPQANVDGTRPASIAGYNLYRRRAGRERGGRPINDQPITETRYIDRSFVYQNEYEYFVRALSQGANGLIESGDSEVLEFTPEDRFKPAVPDPVSIASANGVISLFWPTSAERDVVGYHVYRRDRADGEWVRLTEQPVTPVTFRDDRVTLGQRYEYRVTAIDRFGNESDPSNVVAETAHP